MEVSHLPVRVSLGGWGLLELLVYQLLGSVWLGLDLTGGTGLAHGESFSPSRADFFSGTKHEASFSAMSHFDILALTHSSKVLKGIDLLFVSTMVLKETLLVPLLSMVLKEVVLLTSWSMSWKETFFLPDLPMVLKEVSLPLFLTVSLALLALSFSLMTFMPSTLMVLKEASLSLFFTVSLALLALSFSLMTLMLSTLMVLKEVNLCLSCSLLSCVSLAGDLRGVLVHVHLAMVLEELDEWS